MHTYETRGDTPLITDAKMGSVEVITPSTLAFPMMRNSTRIKHVAPSLVVHESKSDIK
jgi:hypothetical protein